MSISMQEMILGLSINAVITGVIVVSALVLARKEAFEAKLRDAEKLFDTIRKAS